ncbi:FAD-dependent oxidoreductase [Catalinimonas sp. 4WD22]|uniref:phytoene desaturase family protein n=1 Tax=Catalinimonas locisalis TaxID=3133978 RepID=UPI003100FE84
MKKARKLGGQCTSWKHEDFIINGCIHWLVGSGSTNKMHKLWSDLGALDGTEFVNHDRFTHLENVEGEDVILYCNPNQLKAHWLEIAPEEDDFIHNFTKTIQVLIDDQTLQPSHNLFHNIFTSVRHGLKGLYVYREIMKWFRYSCGDIALKLKNPYLKALFLSLGKDMPVIAILYTLAWMNNKEAGYPLGGSAPFINKILNKFLSTGGSIHYNAAVKEIIVHNDCAGGVVLEDGHRLYADYIISAADGYTTIYHMLQGKYKDEKIDHYYLSLPLFRPILFASFGINYSFQDLEGAAMGRSFILKKPLKAGNVSHDRLNIQVYNFDPTLAPEGKSLITSMIETDYHYWKVLADNNEKYKKEKIRTLMEVMERLTSRFPQIVGKFEMMDLATPITYEKYTGVYKGSYEGWKLTKETFLEKMEKKLPGLENFYMAGQWVEPGGGLPPSALSGKSVIQMICKKERLKFISAFPPEVKAKEERKITMEQS